MKSKPPIWQWPVIIGSVLAFLGVAARTYVVYAEMPQKVQTIEKTLANVQKILDNQEADKKAAQELRAKQAADNTYWCDRCGKAGEWREKPPKPPNP